jgi:hypothetical protein
MLAECRVQGWACRLGCPSQRLIARSGKAVSKPARMFAQRPVTEKAPQGGGAKFGIPKVP